MKRKLPIGTSDFKDLRENGFYFVDKSLMIKELIDDSSKVILIPRPRRFGKTLNMSMLRYFFDHNDAAENRKLFDGLDITREPEFDAEQGRYPVIYLTFKDIKAQNYGEAIDLIRNNIAQVFINMQYLINFEKTPIEQKMIYDSIKSQTSSIAILSSSLKLLTDLIYKHNKVKPILLIDEYDTPIHSAYNKRYYDEMISFMSLFLGSVLKDNESLHKSVLTGTLRVSRESIFTGLNNISIYSLLSSKFNDKFGFTQLEVSNILEDFELSYEIADVRKWYNGYIMGGIDVYNPWSIINFVQNHKDGFKPYWLNTSGNDLIKEIIKESPYSVQMEMKDLLDGKPLVKSINENISFPELKSTEHSIYSFLVFSGYLKARFAEHTEEADFYNLSIPNIEVKRLYKDVILNWFKETFEANKSSMMLNALFDKDTELFGDILGDCVIKALSTYDVDRREPERVYQAFLLGLLVSLGDDYEVTSNRESGYGRYDICIVPLKGNKPCIVMELKQISVRESVETALESAINQIEKQKYETTIRQRGYDNVLKLAVVFDGKRVWVKS